MKKLTLILATIALMISTNLFAQNETSPSQVEAIAKEILKAYKNKDAELLKKHASGVLKYAISDSYFEDKDLQNDLKVIEEWDGEIKGIGYEFNNIGGIHIIMASVYFADIPNTEDIYEVLLSNYDGQGWVMFGKGISTEKKEDFAKLSKTLSKNETTQETKPEKKLSIEMANGDTFGDVSAENITECINKLDDDNFFIILKDKEDFLQAAYSDKGYTVEYKEKGVQYTAKDLLSKEKTMELFKKYFNGNTDWNKDVEWEKQ